VSLATVLPPGAVSAPRAKPAVPFVISVVAVLGLIIVALSMSFIDDAPGDIGSSIAGLFHAVGTVEFILALGVLVSAMFLVVGGFDVELWGSVIMALGLASIAALFVVVLEGTFAVVFLSIPGLLAVVAGFLARRKATTKPSLTS
jgi:hypothetical protein